MGKSVSVPFSPPARFGNRYHRTGWEGGSSESPLCQLPPPAFSECLGTSQTRLAAGRGRSRGKCLWTLGTDSPQKGKLGILLLEIFQCSQVFSAHLVDCTDFLALFLDNCRTLHAVTEALERWAIDHKDRLNWVGETECYDQPPKENAINKFLTDQSGASEKERKPACIKQLCNFWSLQGTTNLIVLLPSLWVPSSFLLLYPKII